MRNYADITEEEVRAVYDRTPEVNQYNSWESVKACEPLFLALKNQLIAQEQHMEQPKPVRLFIAIDNASIEPNPQPIKQVRRSTGTVTLNEKQISQLATAMRLARNCLQCPGLSESIKEEALGELAVSQKTLNSFNTTR